MKRPSLFDSAHPSVDAPAHQPARRRWLQHSGALTLGAVAQPSLLLLLGAPQRAHAASIVAVRVWPAADYTRVTLESDVGLTAQYFLTPDTPRLVIDIDGMELNAHLRELAGKVRADDPQIARVRVGQNQQGRVRIVLDLKQGINPQVFALAPVTPYKHRLVFDLYPSEPPDPLLVLVRDREAALRAAGIPSADSEDAARSSGRAAGAVNNALTELMGNNARPEPPAGQGARDDAAARYDDLPAPAVAGARPGGRPAEAEPSAANRSAGSRADEAATARTQPPGPAGINRLIIVAIDPGHGGEDPGAIGPTGLREKDVVLAIGRQLAERINAQPGMRAMLTRDDDFFVPLQERVHKARRVQADLFISIHADAFMKPRARGASVFALSDSGASSAAARWMAKRENQSDEIGGINVAAKDGHVLRALLEMSTARQIRDSLKLGTEVLGHIGKVGKLHKPHVEQASFAVLKAPDIPSILVETAFISNPEEESKLRTRAYQAKLVRALMTGIQRYFAKNPPLTRTRLL